MNKTTSISQSSHSTKLFSFLARTKGSLLNKLLPRWTHKKIDHLLLIPKATDNRTTRLPRDFTQFEMSTRDGTVQAYQTGKGPTVVFVHGWGGGAHLFFPLMRGLAQCGFRSVAFDHLGHGGSDSKPATLQQSISTTNFMLEHTRKEPGESLCAVVGHSTGCIAISSARQALIKDLPLFLISPIFNYKLYFLKKLIKLDLHPELLKQYANRFSKTYQREYRKLELARNLEKYSDISVIAHDESDSDSAIGDSVRFCAKYPLTKLLVTRQCDHLRIINSESVWQELKSHLNYDDTSINFTAEVIYK